LKRAHKHFLSILISGFNGENIALDVIFLLLGEGKL